MRSGLSDDDGPPWLYTSHLVADVSVCLKMVGFARSLSQLVRSSLCFNQVKGFSG